MCTHSNVMISCILAINKSFVDLAYILCPISMPFWNDWRPCQFIIADINLNKYDMVTPMFIKMHPITLFRLMIHHQSFLQAKVKKAE